MLFIASVKTHFQEICKKEQKITPPADFLCRPHWNILVRVGNTYGGWLGGGGDVPIVPISQ